MTKSTLRTTAALGALGAAALALAACSQPEDGATAAAGPSLAGTSWTVTAIDGAPPIAGRDAPSIAFDGEGRVSGATGCNRFSGGFAVGDGGTLTLGGDGAALATTRMACTDELNAQETKMLAVLEAVAGYAVEADRLVLSNASGTSLIEAAPSTP